MDVKHLTNEEKLNEIYEMVHENHKILRSLRSQQYFANILRILYWLVILGVIGSAYYYIQPIIETFSTSGTDVNKTLTQFNEIKDRLPETKFLNQIVEWLRSSRGN